MDSSGRLSLNAPCQPSARIAQAPSVRAPARRLHVARGAAGGRDAARDAADYGQRDALFVEGWGGRAGRADKRSRFMHKGPGCDGGQLHMENLQEGRLNQRTL